MQTHQSQVWVGTLCEVIKLVGENSALAIIAAALLCPQDCRIRNVPSLVDVTRMGQILSALGVKLEQHSDILTSMPMLSDNRRLYELVSQRASFLYWPLLARLELPVYHSQVVVRLSQTG